MTFAPTDEQLAFVDAFKRGENIMGIAMAGCAKTTTLTLMAKGSAIRPSLALAFNVKNKKDLEVKFPQHWDVKTINGLGHMAWNRATGKRCSVEDKKLGNIVKAVLKAENIKDATGDEFIGIIQLVRRARIVGLVPKQFGDRFPGLVDDTYEEWESIGDSIYSDVSDAIVHIARRVLVESITQAFNGVVDFDDQIYMSALFGGVFPKYPVGAVDEAQDLSRLNHIMVSKAMAGQLAVVGDPRQAIYAFRGADSSSMANMRELRPGAWTDLTLSTTFRCPKAVVARQQDHAPGFNAAETAPDGEIITHLGQWNHADLAEKPGNLAILCRNNAPLMGTALRIIGAGRGCQILGREIGKALAKLMKDLCPDGCPAEVALQKIDEWRTRETSKARANGKEERVAIFEDKASCLEAIFAHKDISNSDDALRAIDRMFAGDSLKIILATGHKAKGLEWETVVHLDPWRVPSKYARQALIQGDPIPMEQDKNLKYVIETRTKNTLVNADAEPMQ